MNNRIRLAHLMLIFGRYHTAYQPIDIDKQGGRTYYQSTFASLTSRRKSLNRCCISSSSVASSSFSYMGSSALYSWDKSSSSDMFGRAWQNRALSDIACDKKEEWLTTRVQLLYADTLHRFFGPRRNYYFRQLLPRPPAHLLLYLSAVVLEQARPLFELLRQAFIPSLRTTPLLLYMTSNLMPSHMYPGSIQRLIIAIPNIPKRAHAFRLYSQRCFHGYVHTSKVRRKVKRRSLLLRRAAEWPLLVT
jgi:hypothetical protein